MKNKLTIAIVLIIALGALVFNHLKAIEITPQELKELMGEQSFGATTFPSSQVGQSPSAGLYLQTNGTVSTWASVSATGGGGGTGWASSTPDTTSIYFTGSGNVGIGSTSPTFALTVESETNKVLGVRRTNHFDGVWRYIHTVPGWTDYTAEAAITKGTVTGDLLDACHAQPADSDWVFLGKSTPFTSIYWDIGTAKSATGALTFEYATGTAPVATSTTGWATLTVTDGTNALIQDGAMSFSAPGDWVNTMNVNGTTNLYWVRIGCTTVTFTAEPTAYLIIPSPEQNSLGIYGNYGDTTGMVIDEDGLLTLSNVNTITALGAGTFVSVAVGGALTTASTGAFSDTITASHTLTGTSTVPHVGLLMDGTTAATAALSSKSPALVLGGRYWTGTVSTTTKWSIENYINYSQTVATTTALTFSVLNNATTLYDEKMRIDSSGNVGIGTTNPAGKLDVGVAPGTYKSTLSAVANFYGPDAVAGQVALYSTDAAAVDIGGSFSFGGRNTYNGGVYDPYIFAQVKGAKEGAANTLNGYLSFSTTVVTSAILERMRITSAGNVGIGTAAPGDLLHLSYSSNTAFKKLIFSNIGLTAGSDASDREMGSLDFQTNVAARTARVVGYVPAGAGGTDQNAMKFIVSQAGTPSTAMVIRETGNVGIGTTSPANLLQVNNTTATSTISATVVNGSARSSILGGRIILQDVSGGTCTEITTQTGVITSRAVTCP